MAAGRQPALTELPVGCATAYPPIDSYAFLSDSQTAALVDRTALSSGCVCRGSTAAAHSS